MKRSACKTLHVVRPPDPMRGGVAAGELLYAAVAAGSDENDRVLIFGSSSDRASAAYLGVHDSWLSPLPRHSFVAALAIRRAARACGAACVRIWSRELLRAACGVGRVARVEACLFDLPGDGEVDPWRPGRGCLEALDRLLVPDDHARRRWLDVGAGAGAGRIEIAEPLLMPFQADRAVVRSRLGVGDSIVLAPLGADPRRVDGRAFTFVSGVLELLGCEHTLLLPDQCQRVASVLRFRRNTGLRNRLVLVTPPLLGIMPAADILIAPKWGEEPSAVRSMLESRASDLGIPVASIAGWERYPGLRHGTLSPDIRANVGPVVAAYDSIACSRVCSEA